MTSMVRYWQAPWGDTSRRIVAHTGAIPALVDSTGVGDPVLEALQVQSPRGNVEGVKFTSPSKQQVMEGPVVAIQQGKIRYPDGPIVRELETLEYEHAPTSATPPRPAYTTTVSVLWLWPGTASARGSGKVTSCPMPMLITIRWCGVCIRSIVTSIGPVGCALVGRAPSGAPPCRSSSHASHARCRRTAQAK